MLWLPRRVDSHVICRLPLADFSAVALLSMFAGDDSAQSTELVSRAVKHDAALALWAVCAADQTGCAPLSSVDAVVRWLLSEGRQALVWPSAVEAELTPEDTEWRGRYHRLAAVSVAVAERAGQLANDRPDTVEQSFLLGLLHAAEQWQKLGTDTANGVEKCQPLPLWLVESLKGLRSAANESQPVMSCVAHAHGSLDEAAALARYHAIENEIVPPLSAIVRCLPAITRDFSARAAQRFEDCVEAAKLSAMAEFAAGAGHEINNPIAVIAGRAQLLLADEVNPQRRHELAVIHSQAMRVYEMIADMMLFARPPMPKPARCDLAAVLSQVVHEIGSKAAERGLKLNVALPDGAMFVHADALQISIAVRAICDNAFAAAATAPGGMVSIRLRASGKGGTQGSEVLVDISDNGGGVPEEIRRHLFDPFYSGRQAGRGLGMGLAKAWRIIANHRGRIGVSSVVGEGTTFSLALPSVL